jgi:MFS transporter, ACS family, tartrate transporter
MPSQDSQFSTHTPEFAAGVVSKVTFRLLPFLFFLYVVAYLDRINVGFAALQMQRELRFNDAVYGLGSGIFFAGYFFFQVPSNLVLVRVGARRWIAVLMVIWGVISCSMIFIRTPMSFYTLRFLLGAAEAGFFPGIILFLKDWFPANARARTVAWFMAAGPVSGIIGGPISGWILLLHHRAGLSGWQWLFLLEGLPAIVLALVVLAVLTDKPEQARWMTDLQREWLLLTLEEERTAVPVDRTGGFAAFRLPSIWLLGFVYFSLNTTAYGISLWLPKIIRNFSGMNTFRLGLLSTVPYILTVIAMVLSGRHSDRTGERRWHVAVPALCGAIALGLGAFSHSLVLVLAVLSIGMMSVFSMCGPFWSIPSSFLTGTAAATGIALINSVGNLGSGFGPYIIGIFRHSTGEFTGGFLVMSTALGLGALVALLATRNRPEPRTAKISASGHPI